MKKVFTFNLFLGLAILSRSQAVLNEVYPQPGIGNHEFFELYNENNYTENLDNYTLIAFYEEGSASGFYVLDLPNTSVNANDYYVGASQTPFNIQGQSGVNANFSWNAMPASGSLTKWEKNGSSYTSVSVPADLNELFVKITGAGGVYHIFIYKNGRIVNGIVGGLNTSVVPSYIKSMPDLYIDMSNSSPDFTINFNSIPDNALEYISSSTGTNNGYYRSSDGLCGEWLKSDNGAQHTPGSTNGGATSSSGSLSISAVISHFETDSTKSLLTYNISAGPGIAFPVVVSVYSDLGIESQFDINDTLIDSRTIANAAMGPQNIILQSWNISVIIVVKAASDCYDTTLAIGSYWFVLPVKLVSIQGNINSDNKVQFQWKVDNNEMIKYFEVEKSYDGKEFKTAGLVFTSEKKGVEDYLFYETLPAFEKVMYRLKIISRTNEVGYSRILIFQSKNNNNNLKIIGNPVIDQLTLSYTSGIDKIISIKIYDLAGKTIMCRKINSSKGENLVNFLLPSYMNPAIYVVEINTGTSVETKKFIKQ